MQLRVLEPTDKERRKMNNGSGSMDCINAYMRDHGGKELP